MAMKMLCFLGLHKWRVVKRVYESALKASVRYRVHGADGCTESRTSGDRAIEDRFCTQCGKRDFRIARAVTLIYEQEEKVAALLKEILEDSEEDTVVEEEAAAEKDSKE